MTAYYILALHGFQAFCEHPPGFFQRLGARKSIDIRPAPRRASVWRQTDRVGFPSTRNPLPGPHRWSDAAAVFTQFPTTKD
ncbi:MAG: hypothetical protein KatS3mg111_3806 [Pirellulaceae bacterium]|nr:MAG: hypothetical protein KatS3mg111_3806 [Pirellulaceae bacterium]